MKVSIGNILFNNFNSFLKLFSFETIKFNKAIISSSPKQQQQEKEEIEEEKEDNTSQFLSNSKRIISIENLSKQTIQQLVFNDLKSSNGIRSIWDSNSSSSSPLFEGYLIGSGDIYGGNYTIYPTLDPSSSHAIATISIQTISNHSEVWNFFSIWIK